MRLFILMVRMGLRCTLHHSHEPAAGWEIKFSMHTSRQMHLLCANISRSSISYKLWPSFDTHKCCLFMWKRLLLFIKHVRKQLLEIIFRFICFASQLVARLIVETKHPHAIFYIIWIIYSHFEAELVLCWDHCFVLVMNSKDLLNIE